jgi:ATP-dependent DNA helicase RecG
MNTDSTGALIKKGESEVLEFKEGSDKEVIETAVAFANSKGGTILIGVREFQGHHT